MVELLQEPAQTVVTRQSDQFPIKAAVVIPLAPLPKLTAHKKQLLARMTIHPCVKHPEIRELLPFIARHFVDERTFAVHDLIVAQDENEMLLKRIDQRESDVVVMEPAEDRIE